MKSPSDPQSVTVVTCSIVPVTPLFQLFVCPNQQYEQPYRALQENYWENQQKWLITVTIHIMNQHVHSLVSDTAQHIKYLQLDMCPHKLV